MHACANTFLMLQMNAFLGCLGAFFGFFPWILRILGVTFRYMHVGMFEYMLRTQS